MINHDCGVCLYRDCCVPCGACEYFTPLDDALLPEEAAESGRAEFYLEWFLYTDEDADLASRPGRIKTE